MENSGAKKSSTRKYLDPKSNMTIRATRSQIIPTLTDEWMIPVCRNNNDQEIQIEREKIQQMPKPKVIYKSDFDLLILIDRQLQLISTISNDNEIQQIAKIINEIVNRQYFWKK